MSVRITVTVDKTAQVLAAMHALAATEVLVGIPAERNFRRADGSWNRVGNAAIGFIQEHGSPARNIPPRPFLVPGVRKARGRTIAALRTAAKDAFKNPLSVERGFNAAGLAASAEVKRLIQSQPASWPALKQGTKDARKRRGFAGTKKLIVTGQLLNSITYVIRAKKSRHRSA